MAELTYMADSVPVHHQSPSNCSKCRLASLNKASVLTTTLRHHPAVMFDVCLCVLQRGTSAANSSSKSTHAQSLPGLSLITSQQLSWAVYCGQDGRRLGNLSDRVEMEWDMEMVTEWLCERTVKWTVCNVDRGSQCQSVSHSLVFIIFGRHTLQDINNSVLCQWGK